MLYIKKYQSGVNKYNVSFKGDDSPFKKDPDNDDLPF